MNDSTLIRNISRLVTMEPGPGRDGALGVIEQGALVIEGGRIAWCGRGADLPAGAESAETVDARGMVVMPGLVDCHTHIVHAGFRQREFDLRTRGTTYQEIAREGGGIMSTVRATRAASEEKLVCEGLARLQESLAHGVTTVEIKTGYGLDYDAEMRLAGAIGTLAAMAEQTVVGTCLGAHVVPPEYRARREEYVELVAMRLLRDVARTSAMTACDVFVEEGAYTADEARRIAHAARSLGLSLHLHVDQFTDVCGGELAAELRALSADHLDRTSDAGLDAMARAGVVGVLLPGASFVAGRGHYPDARRLFARGVTVAIATDYNPGTCPCLDPWLMATIAAAQMGVSCDEALKGITRHAAQALGLSDRGAIAPGKRADLVVLDAPDEYFPLYRFGTSFVHEVLVAGEPRWRRA